MARIVYLSWPAKEITGGIKMIFRHAEVLREAGFSASVATPDGEPPTWFETTAPLIPFKQLVANADILVFPENHAGFFKEFASWSNRKVVFCQNQFQVHRGLADRQDYADFGVSAIICPSQEVASFCRRRFPDLPVVIVPYPVDRALFRPREPKHIQIAFMPRKRASEAAFIRDLFRAENPAFRAVPWVEITKVSEKQVAQTLGESSVYLSLSRFEAFGLSTLEALSSGCIVAGFTGIGGREYATSKNGFWAPEDDCVVAVEQLVRAVRLSMEGGDRYRDMVESAGATADYYSPARFRERVTTCWKALTGDTENRS
jgi:glycosyltransferase involved in cell wall biosynthesis